MRSAPEAAASNAAEPEEAAWSLPAPARAPAPTSAPAGIALGVAMGLWGIVTHWLMTVAGAALFVVSLWCWIAEIRLDWRRDDG